MGKLILVLLKAAAGFGKDLVDLITATRNEPKNEGGAFIARSGVEFSVAAACLVLSGSP